MRTTSDNFEWFDLQNDHGVLELHENVTAPGPPLELHVHLSEGGVIAFWLTDAGAMLRPAEVGEA